MIRPPLQAMMTAQMRTALKVCTSGAGAVLLAVSMTCMQGPARAAQDSESYALHGQFTYTEQQTSGFNAPYAGQNSLTPHTNEETVDVTLFLGRRLWPGAEIWIAPEIDQGFGLDDTLGPRRVSERRGLQGGGKSPLPAVAPHVRTPNHESRRTARAGRPGAAAARRRSQPEPAGVDARQDQRDRHLRQQSVRPRSTK